MDQISKFVVGGFIGGSITLIFFFVKEYFKGLKVQKSEKNENGSKAKIEALEKDIVRIEGKVQTIDDRSHATSERVGIIGEGLKAVWRVIDAPPRTSDKEKVSE